MIKILVNGVCGRMGKRIINIINDTDGALVAAALETTNNPFIGSDVGECAGTGNIGVNISSDIKDAVNKSDVIIDFSAPLSSLTLLRETVLQNKASVIGTTGFTEDEKKELNVLASKIPCVFAPNMSIGVNVMLSLLEKAAPLFDEDYDVEIIEAHHRFKKDAPSGTAMKIAETLASSLNRDLSKVANYKRHGMIGERPKKEIGIQTIRAGDIVGEHTVIFGGIGERIEITHKAQNRDTFAKGAVHAAKWIIGKSIGVYNMRDVLGIA